MVQKNIVKHKKVYPDKLYGTIPVLKLQYYPIV